MPTPCSVRFTARCCESPMASSSHELVVANPSPPSGGEALLVGGQQKRGTNGEPLSGTSRALWEGGESSMRGCEQWAPGDPLAGRPSSPVSASSAAAASPPLCPSQMASASVGVASSSAPPVHTSVVDVDAQVEDDDEPQVKRQKKTTLEIWFHFTKHTKIIE